MSAISKLVAAATREMLPPVPNAKTKIDSAESSTTVLDKQSTSRDTMHVSSPVILDRLRQYQPFKSISTLDAIDVSAEAAGPNFPNNTRDGIDILLNKSTANAVSNNTVSKNEHIINYVYGWAAQLAEIPDPDRRKEVLTYVMGTLECALKAGIERTNIVLLAKDVNGVKKGTKKTVEGEVDIQVTITSKLKKAAPVNEERSHSKGKRVAEEDGGRLGKRLKLSDKNNNDDDETSNDGQDSPLPTSSEAVDKAAEKADQKYLARYRQYIFKRRLNHILKAAGKTSLLGKCEEWEVVRDQLRDVGVKANWRNRMLRDFQIGYKKWDGDTDIDSNEELAGYALEGFKKVMEKKILTLAEEESKEIEARNEKIKTGRTKTETAEVDARADAQDGKVQTAEKGSFNFEQTQPPGHIDSARVTLEQTSATLPQVSVNRISPGVMILEIRTGMAGFDPAHYRECEWYEYNGYRFQYNPLSSVKQRVFIQDILTEQIDSARESGDFMVGVETSVREAGGVVVAAGHFLAPNQEAAGIEG